MTSASLSSCVDTDEPDSLENLRNAVAQEVQANATLLNAKADVEKAYIAVVNAQAKQEEAKAAAAEYENVATKANAECRAQVDQIKMEENEATKAQKIEAAKLAAEKATNDAKANLEAAVAAYKAAIETAKTTVRNAEFETMKAELQNKVNIAKLNAEGLSQKKVLEDGTVVEGGDGELLDKLKAVTKAQKGLLEAQEDLATYLADDCFEDADRQELKSTLDEKEAALSVAKAGLEFYKNSFETKGYEAFADLWKKYEADVLSAQYKADSIKIAIDQLTRELAPLNEAKTTAENKWSGSDAESAVSKFKKKIQDALDENAAWIPSHTVTVKISNIMVAAQCAEEYGKGDVKFKKEGNATDGYQFKAVGYAQKNDITKDLEDLQTKLDNISKDKLAQNSEIVDYLRATVSDDYKTAETAYMGADKKSGALKTWRDAITEYNKADVRKDAGKFGTALTNLETAAQALFGSYAAGIDWQKFTSTDVEGHVEEYLWLNGALTKDGKLVKVNGDAVTVDGNEVGKVADYKAITTAAWAELYKDMGVYGTWKAEKDKMEAAKQSMMSDAATDLEALKKVIADFKAKTDLLNNSTSWQTDGGKNADNFKADLEKNGYNDAAKAADDVKTAREAFKTAEAAAKVVADKLQAAKNESAAFLAQDAENQARAKEYHEKLKALSTDNVNLSDQERYDLYEVYKADALLEKENAVTKATIERDDAKATLDAFDKGELDEKHKADIEKKTKAVKKAEDDLKEAQEEYDRIKSYYGIN
jgi:hypothetical protein